RQAVRDRQLGQRDGGLRAARIAMRAYRSLCGAAAVFTLAAHLAAQNAPPNPQAADDHFVIDTGARLYLGQCSACHGTNGDLINGVDLRAGKFLTVRSDPDRTRLLPSARPAAGMATLAALHPAGGRPILAGRRP